MPIHHSRLLARSFVALLGSLLAVDGHAADVMYVSNFNSGLASLGTVVRFDLPSATGTTIVTGLTGPEAGGCSFTGRIYVAESNSDLLTSWDVNGFNPINIIPAAGAPLGPESPTFDLSGNLYFNTRNRLIGAASAWMVPGGGPPSLAVQLFAPFTDFGEGAHIVSAGPHAGALLLGDRTGQIVWISEPPGAPPVPIVAATNFPTGDELMCVLTNGCGDIFVSSRTLLTAEGTVYHFDPNGTFIEVYASGLPSVSYFDFDSSGNMYVADNTDAVWLVTPSRTVSMFASGLPTATGVTICRDRRVPTCGITMDVRFDSFAARFTHAGTGTGTGAGTTLAAVDVTWTTLTEEGTNGFVVERAVAEQGPYERVGDFVASHGSGLTYRSTDATVAAGSRPWYRVVEYTDNGRGDATSAFRAENALTPGSGGTGRARNRRGLPR